MTIDAVLLPTWREIRKCGSTIARSCGIGAFIGLLPAEGGTVAAMMGYNEAKRWAKDKTQFGKGDLRGIAGPEAANNAATGAAMVPNYGTRHSRLCDSIKVYDDDFLPGNRFLVFQTVLD